MATRPTFPRCTTPPPQARDGRTPAGSQRHRCAHCGCRYTPQPREQGYDEEVRFQALQLYLEGCSMREIARRLGAEQQGVANWMDTFAR